MELPDLFASIGPVLLGLVAIVVAGWVCVLAIRKWMKRDDPGDSAFTLEDLRRLKREGRLTDEEFTRARDAMLAAARNARNRAEQRGGPGEAPPEDGRSRR